MVTNDCFELILDVAAKGVIAKAVAAVHEEILSGPSSDAAAVHDYEQRIGQVAHASRFAAKEVDGQMCMGLTVDREDHTLL